MTEPRAEGNTTQAETPDAAVTVSKDAVSDAPDSQAVAEQTQGGSNPAAAEAAEAAAGDTTADDPSVDDTTADEATADEATADEATADEATADEATPEKTTADETAADPAVLGEVIDIDAPPEAPTAPGPEDRIAALEARLKTVSAAYKAQVEEVEVTKQRLTRQAAYKAERTRGEVVGTFFEPVENLRRAIEVVRKDAGDDAASGLDLVLHQFMEAFKQLGVEEVSGKGARFDPTQHEALTMMPVSDPALDGVVVEVFDTGYRIGSTLLKAARVVVGTMPDGEADA